jgi:hypothetical protein
MLDSTAYNWLRLNAVVFTVMNKLILQNAAKYFTRWRTNIFTVGKKVTALSGIGSNLLTDTASYLRLMESSSAPL